jgi:hypothetical protein
MSADARGCLAALLLPVFFAAFAMGAIFAGVSVYDLATQNRPIKCGHDVMPDSDRYVCFPGGASYEDLVKGRHREIDRAPGFAVGGGITAVVGATGLFFCWRHGGRTGRG